MPSNEGHIHWLGGDDEELSYLEQQLRITADGSGDPEGSLRIRAFNSTLLGLYLPNSTLQEPRWDAIPDTNPVLEARQDGYHTGHIRIRQA